MRTGAQTCSARCRAALSRLRLSDRAAPTAAGSVRRPQAAVPHSGISFGNPPDAPLQPSWRRLDAEERLPALVPASLSFITLSVYPGDPILEMP